MLFFPNSEHIAQPENEHAEEGEPSNKDRDVAGDRRPWMNLRETREYTEFRKQRFQRKQRFDRMSTES
ncbi:hypothetical protein EYF80_022392 [Liparis tanakae]|uniref:Uncharacterized protein n=1 Tax=Liparis tanakae TaxID=230148 RepID=A0A4Z2HNJ6_9TELE|nr:hypothetical protein EYF80_022392 [Liparis tanakae]